MTKSSMSLNGYFECHDGLFRKVVHFIQAKTGQQANALHDASILVRTKCGTLIKSHRKLGRHFDVDAWKLQNCKAYGNKAATS